MKVVWKVLTGVALVAALLIAARVIMYGVGSLPFMNAFSTPPSNSDSEAKSGGAVSVSTPSNPPTEPSRTYQPPPAPASGQSASRPSSVPNPPSMYERARRAGNRPNSSPDE